MSPQLASIGGPGYCPAKGAQHSANVDWPRLTIHHHSDLFVPIGIDNLLRQGDLVLEEILGTTRMLRWEESANLNQFPRWYNGVIGIIAQYIEPIFPAASVVGTMRTIMRDEPILGPHKKKI